MKKKILVIEDETDLCALIKIVLLKENYTVDCAFSLAEASQKLVDHPEIVLMDNNLPDGTGLEYIQMHPVDFMQSSVIMMSAEMSDTLREGIKNEGIEAFLEKPFSMRSMKEIIGKIA